MFAPPPPPPLPSAKINKPKPIEFLEIPNNEPTEAQKQVQPLDPVEIAITKNNLTKLYPFAKNERETPAEMAKHITSELQSICAIQRHVCPPLNFERFFNDNEQIYTNDLHCSLILQLSTISITSLMYYIPAHEHVYRLYHV